MSGPLLVAVYVSVLLQFTTTRADNGCSVSTVVLQSNVPSDSMPQIGDSVAYSFTCNVTVNCSVVNGMTMDSITINITNGLGDVVMSSSSTVNNFVSDIYSTTVTVGSPIQLSNAGLYNCTVNINETMSSMSSTSSLNVTIPNTHTVSINNDDAQVQVTQGGVGNLTCSVTLQQTLVDNLGVMGSFIRLSWSPKTVAALNTRVLSPSTSISELFTIGDVSIAYADVYMCSAEIFYNGSNSDYVTVPQPISEDTINLTVKVQTPSVSVPNMFVVIGDPVTLLCTVNIFDDNPLLVNASVTWTPSDGAGPATRSSPDTTFISKYTIDNVGANDTMNYTCSATINPIDNSNIISSDPSGDDGALYATGVTINTNATIILDISPYNTFSSMCTTNYYPSNAPISNISIDLLSNNMTGETVSPSSYTGSSLSSPVQDDRVVTVSMTGSTIVSQYTCQVNITIDGITLTSINSDSVNVTIRGPAKPVSPVSISNLTTNDSATINWTIPSIAYTPETYTVKYGLTCGNLNESISEMTRNIDNLLFLTDMNEVYNVTINGLISGEEYCFLINSSNTFGSIETSTMKFMTNEGVPSKPKDLQSTEIGTDFINLTWNVPSTENGIISFYNYTCDSTGNSVTGGVTGTAAVVSGLSPFTEYQCTVTASTSAGMGDPSDAITVTTMEDVPSGPPTAFTITSSNDNPNVLDLTWSPPEPGFRNGIITGYEYNCSNNPGDIKRTSNTTTTVMGLEAFTEYTCNVKAVTGAGSGPTAIETERTSEAAPEAVTDLIFINMSETSFFLSWTEPRVLNGILSHYNISVSEYSSSDEVIYRKQSNSTEDTVTSEIFMTGVPYYVNVSAVTGGGEGPATSILNFTQQGTPAQVMGVSASRVSDTVIDVSWNRLTIVEAQGFFKYRVVLTPLSEDSRKRQDGDPIIREVEPDITSIRVSGLDPSTSYSVTVTAVNDMNIGELSTGIPTIPPITESPTIRDDNGNVGIIVGVICGCLALLLVIIVVVVALLIVRKKMDQTKDPEVHQNLAILDQSKRDEEDGSELKLLSVKHNPEFNERIQAVGVEDFAEHVHQLHMNRDLGFEEEYESLKSIPIGSFTVAKMQANIPKNRFDNVYSYDDSRVVLPIPEGDNSDYINASFIDGYNRPKAYIAAQGPLVNTVVDFWHMVWEFQLPTIVMLTELIERGIEKCTCYYPRSTNDTLDVGRGLQVTCTEQQQFVEYKFKKFLLVNTNKGGGRLDVVHYHFLAWPDHGVPADKTVMMAFARRVRQTHPPEGPPLIVHCSAGVGRTGTFIVLDTMMQRLDKKEGSLNIYELVADMRSKRTLMVQTMAQYIYTHDALSEYIICGDTSITTKKLRDKMNELSKVSGGESGYKKQLDLLNQISRVPSEGHCSDSLSKQNVVKNRYSQVVTSLPYNETRVRLRTTSGVGDYINASIVDGYKHKGAFLATQVPLESTTGDLWRMVWEQWSASMVMLCSLDEEETLHCFWPQKVDEKQVHGVIEVKLVSEKEEKDFTVRKFELSQESNYINLATGNADKLLVTQYQYNQWPVDGKPSKCDTLLKLLDQLLKTQKLSGNKAITVMCNNGIDRTGAFICLYSQLERVKVEGIADIFQFIKASRFNRPGLVQSVDNYVFCHELLLEFLNSFDQYENFK